MPNGHMSAHERVADSARRPLTNAASLTPTPYLAVNNAGEAILVAEFTDDEEDNNQLYEIQSINRNVGEDVVRTGEASRLRRRGAVHGRRPQLPYVTLICGAPLPWRFKFADSEDFEYTRSSSLGSLMQRYESLKRPSTSQYLPLEFPSTGCRAILTNRAYVNRSHHIYSAQVVTEYVTRVDRSYLNAEQKDILVNVLMNTWGPLDWQGLACSNCGNIIGFRYAPAVFDEQGKLMHDNTGPSGYTPKERFAFFASAVTSSKPYDFTTRQHHSNPYHWRYLEPPTATATTNPNSGSFSEYRPQLQTHLDTTVSHSQGFRPYRYRHHHIPSSQDRHSSISFPLASHEQAHLQPQQANPRPPPSFRSSSPLSHHGAWSESFSPEEFGPDDPEQQTSGMSWATWHRGPAFGSDDEDHNIGDSVQRPGHTSWETWRPDPVFQADDRDLDIGELSLTEAISILRTTQTHDDTPPGLESPWLRAITVESRSTDASDAVEPREPDREAVFPTGTVDTNLVTLQDQHAPNVPPVGGEHEPLELNTANTVSEAEVSVDSHIDYTFGPPALSSQRQLLRFFDVEILNDPSADDSQAHHGTERVHDSMVQSESNAIGTIRREAGIDPILEFETTAPDSNPPNLLSITPSNSMLPTPLPIAYESPATVVDLEASNETTGEMESVGILVEVPSPPPDATSGFGSAVVVPSLLSQPSMESTVLSDGIGPLRTSSLDPSSPPSSLSDEPSNDPSNTGTSETASVASNHPLDAHTSLASTSIPDGSEEALPSSASYRHYTPPLPPSRDLAPLRQSPSYALLTSVPLSSSEPAPLFTPLESEDGLSAGPSVSSEGLEMENVVVVVSESLDYVVEASVPAEEETEISPPEQAPSAEPNRRCHSTENTCIVEEHLVNNLISHSTSSSPSSSSSSSRHIITAAPVSHPQPLPANSPILRELMEVGVPSASRRFSRHASVRSSTSQQRSSSRRSWRTPRELLESPVPIDNGGDDDVDNSISRLRSHSIRDTESISRNENRSSREARPLGSASRRIRGHSRNRRRRLSSSSRRDSRLSSTSISAPGATFHTHPSDSMRFPNPFHIPTSIARIESQLHMGGDTLHRHPGLTAASPELIRRGSLPNIHRPRLTGLIRRDSLPVLSMQRQPLSDLTATFIQQPESILNTVRFPDFSSRARLNQAVREHSPVSTRRHRGERLAFDVSNSRHNEQEADTGQVQEDRLGNSEQENEPINNPEDVLTPRPRRHTTMPVFIPSPPSDSESEHDDTTQNHDGTPFSRGPTSVPWMPWEWCWQDQQRIPSESGLQIDTDAIQITEESDKEE